MPNYCSNTLEFYCEPHEVMPLKESTQNSSREFDFNRVLPCPVEQLRITYGAISESDWKVKHWGTESNALGGQEFRVGETASEPQSWWFETRWSPPLPLIQALSRKFPRIPMRLIFNEDLRGLHGSICFIAGQEVPAAKLPVPMAMRTWLTK